MIGILIITYPGIGSGLLNAAKHIVGTPPESTRVIDIANTMTPEDISALIKEELNILNNSDGVLILVDLYGATHTNIACKYTHPDKIELIAGLSLPMLLRVLNYRMYPIQEIMKKLSPCSSDNIIYTLNNN